jgi:SAM-dependent methyltransferase
MTPDPDLATATRRLEPRQLRQELIRLGPWHYQVEVAGGVRTGDVAGDIVRTDGDGLGTIAFLDVREEFQGNLLDVYPEGLEGRSVLDCACNCGAYSFWAKEIGAGACLGFDARDHWIEQARFLAAQREAASDGMRFEVCDVYNVAGVAEERFDVTLFQGIFYHLPEPINALKSVADLTSELLVVDTATRNGLPDGMLAVAREGLSELLSGVYGLCWFPTGPTVLQDILRWVGFPETRVVFWSAAAAGQPAELGRLMLLAARDAAIFVDYDLARRGAIQPRRSAAERPRATGRELGADEYATVVAGVRNVVEALLPQAVTVAVVSKGDDALLEFGARDGWHFPRDETGRYAGFHPADTDAAIEAVEGIRDAGADFLVFPSTALWWLEHYAGLQEHLWRTSTVVHQGTDCVIYALAVAPDALPADRAPDAVPEPQPVMEWPRDDELAARVTALVAAVLPADAPVGVLGGDTTLLAGDGRPVHPVPWNGADPVRLAQALREDGVAYLLVPATELSSLRNGAREELARRHRVVLRQERTCIVFELRDPVR